MKYLLITTRIGRNVLTLLSLLCCFETATACGGFFCQPQQPVLQAGENIAFGVRQNGNSPNVVDVTMAVQINYQGPAENFAWILPVPVVPQISVGSDILFEALFKATRPMFEFTVDNDRSTTCTDFDLDGMDCEFDDISSTGGVFAAESGTVTGEGAVELDRGIVGPFEFVTLEAAEGRPESVFEWLETNGYDQPDETEPLLTFYAGMEMKFVALKLLKESESGDIRPLILEYQISGSLDDTPIACVPIQLTAIAATPDMPIQVYLLAPHRGIPLNYADVLIDDNFIDWVGCNRSGQDCYLNNYRNLFQVAAADISGTAFVTEYAGSIDIVDDVIALDINLNELYEATSALDFLNLLATSDVPDITLVHSIIERHIPNDLTVTDGGPPFCQNLANIYTPDSLWIMDNCVEYVDYGDKAFDAVKLANELDEQVFKPAQDAQDWVNSYAYLTRVFAQMDPEEMTKDPFFAFNSELEDVSRFHQAVGVPLCDITGPIGLEIYVENLPDDLESPTFVDAFLSTCGGWVRTTVDPLFGSFSPAFSFTGFSYAGEEISYLFRDSENGTFSADGIQDLIDVLDDRMPNQTVPDASSACQALPVLVTTGSIIMFAGLLEWVMFSI